jgi:hypothetical protein
MSQDQVGALVFTESVIGVSTIYDLDRGHSARKTESQTLEALRRFFMSKWIIGTLLFVVATVTWAQTRKSDPRLQYVGAISINSANPKALAGWYTEKLGLNVSSEVSRTLAGITTTWYIGIIDGDTELQEQSHGRYQLWKEIEARLAFASARSP